MILYALIVTFFLGFLIRPVVINYLALRKQMIEDAKMRHPSNQDNLTDWYIRTHQTN